MADIFVQDQPYQGASAPSMDFDYFANGNTIQGSSQACISDLTPPTFSGINFIDIESRGQIRVKWNSASDATLPIRYEIYIKPDNATGLFSVSNIVALTPNLQYDIFYLPNGSFLQNGVTYFVGVKAIDGVSNRDNNTVSMSVISTGILTSADLYQCDASHSVDATNDWQLTIWANKNGILADSSNSVLGTASYQVYNTDGTPIVGMSESGITANAEGLYIATPIPCLLDSDKAHDNYKIKVSVIVDGEERTNIVGISGEVEQYRMFGVSSVDTSNNLVGSFWTEENGKIVTDELGTGSYQAYMADGTLIPGLSESGILPDSNGFYSITPFPLPPEIDPGQSYIVKVSAIVHGTVREHNVILESDPTAYSCRTTFSINALNQLEATFWATKNDLLVDPSVLGTASYQIYDKSGVAVAGLNQSGIVADVNGFFHITPVAATLLTDLTHYTAKITIEVAGQNRTSVKGFTLLGN